MATSPILGLTLPNTTSTDQVPADLMTVFTAAEKFFVGSFASSSTRDTKIPTPVGGMVAWLVSPGKYTYYDAILAGWRDLMNPNAWTTFTPTLQTSGGTAFTLGGGSTQIGRYQQIGKTVNFQCTWNFGTAVAGPGGGLVFVLPPGLPGANVTGLQQMGDCSLYVPSYVGTGTGPNFVGFWSIQPAATVAVPHFPVSPTTSSMDLFQDTSDGGTAGTGIPRVTGTTLNYPIQPGGTLTAAGTYQIA